MSKTVRWFILAGLVLLAIAFGTRFAPTSTTPEGLERVELSGVVMGSSGPEAGVWVVAETSDLGTGFQKIVVTDDDGRFLVPDLPEANYDVWVRGYGLADSPPKPAQPSEDVTISVHDAASPQEAAKIYPANYWYSLLHVPPASEFPGTGPDGNGIPPTMRTQAHWRSALNDGCRLCHQMGNPPTREILYAPFEDAGGEAEPVLRTWAHAEDLGGGQVVFESMEDAWDYRLQLDGLMYATLNRMGRERALEMFADWTKRVMGGEVPPTPPRPQGIERNVVLTMWDWGASGSYLHDLVSTDKRDPTLYAGAPVYGADLRRGMLTVMDPVANTVDEMQIPVQEGFSAGGSYNGGILNGARSPFWGDAVPLYRSISVHNPMMDHRNRVWMTSAIRATRNQPEWCRDGSDHPSARYFPMNSSSRQISMYDIDTETFSLVDSCFSTHHLQFSEDEDHTLWFSGDTQVIGWLNTRLWDETGDEKISQGWCPTVIDTNGDGRITRPWNEGRQAFDPSRDLRTRGFAYGINYNPADGSIWFARRGTPGAIYRFEAGENPPETCITEIYEPPFETPAVDADQWGHDPRGVDLDRDGVVWTALSGSGHLASFDRSKCDVLSGPTATGQHCPEGWTLHASPGPQFQGVTASGSADFHYYNWVDQFNTLGLGNDVPIVAGTGSDSMLAFLPESGEWVIMRVPFPLGFYSRLVDGRIDDPDAGWKGRGLWATYGTAANWHNEGGREQAPKAVHFQIRPDPLAR